MKAAAESQKYDELKNEFFANISHEFRTPLNVILGTLQLMGLLRSEKYDHEISTRMNKYIGSMKQNCYRLLRLTNNLIDMTRLDTGFYEVNLQYCNIVEVVEDITLSVADFIENRGIELIFDTDVEEKIIAVDTDKIERIMLNLLSNAVKFTEQRGIITVSIHDKGESIEISVKDTGIGIPEDKLTIIFERFRQVNSSLTRDREGSGIGLSLTQHLVKLLGGSINVVSRVGEGSEFMIELPCIEKNGEDQEEPFAYKNKSHVDRINIEFSDIYSVSDDHKSRDSD
jgi:two-component system CheB/CheR fusion protein